MSSSSARLVAVITICASFVLALSMAARSRSFAQTTVQGLTPPRWRASLPATLCTDGQHTHCHFSSPVAADILGDPRPEIVAATHDGRVAALRHDGSIAWIRDTAGAFGMSSTTQDIRSSPAVGDIDGDGDMEIVVGTGNVGFLGCTQGGVIVLNHNGQVVSGWPQLADDWDDPHGCADGIASTPALGDLDNDGTLEIVAGGFDKKIHVWNHDGSRFQGFSVDSYHYQFRGWNILIGRLADTLWGSPSLADLDGDGFLDIIINADEGYHESFGGWTCPYALPPGWDPGYCGGSTYVVDRFGNYLPGFPRYTYEAMQSSPAVVDLNGDGDLEIVTGTGTFYHLNSPEAPTDGFRVYAFTADGGDLPGWQGGKVVAGATPSSPGVGDLDGDGDPEVVFLTLNGWLYAWHHNGALVHGFPTRPTNHFGHFARMDVGKALVLADYDGDDAMEILFNIGWQMVVVDGDGELLTSTYFPGNVKPIYTTDGLLLNTPLVADFDGNGRLEVAVQNSDVTVWEFPAVSERADWPMFRQTPDRTGGDSQVLPRVNLELESFEFLIDITDPQQVERTVEMAVTGGPFTWSWETTASFVSVEPAAGSSTGDSVLATVIVDPTGLPEGQHEGELMLEVTVTPVDRPPVTLSETYPVTVNVMEIVGRVYLSVVSNAP